MEKHTPHYKLDVVKAAVAARGATAFTQSAFDGARAMGLALPDMLAAVAGLHRIDFYKSMTTHVDHRIWQGVYHAITPAVVAYVKVSLVADRPVISFKEK